MSIFSFLSHLFLSLFNSTKAAWEKLPVATQNSILNGSEILHIINAGVDADPAAVAATIEATFPTETNIYDGLVAVAKGFNLIADKAPVDLPGVIALIQAHLKSLDSSTWPAIISGAAGLLGSILAGKETPFEVVLTLLQWVYTNLVKPKVVTIAPVPTVVTGVATPNAAEPVS